MNKDKYGRERTYGVRGKGRPAWNKLPEDERKLRKAARNKAWREANREKVKANARRFYGHPDPTRPMPDECECCGKPCSSGRSLALDHCHETGEFRGWLCGNCNTGIGKLGDNPEGLRQALNYFDKIGRLA